MTSNVRSESENSKQKDGDLQNVIEAINNNQTGQTRSDEDAAGAAHYLSLYRSLLVQSTDNIQRPQIAWGQNHVDENGRSSIIPLGEIGDFSVITGRAKSRKSFAIAIATATALRGKCNIGNLVSNIDKGKKVIVFDTEQKEYHRWRATQRIAKMAGYLDVHPENLEFCGLRGLSAKECWEIISAVINSRDDIGMVMIDGIIDVLEDGGLTERADTVKVLTQIMKWTEEKQIHIVTVLHKNPGSDKLRGHIGTEALNKAGIVINVEDNGDGTSTVTTNAARDRSFDPFAFAIDADGLPIESDVPQKLDKSESVNLSSLDDNGIKALIRLVYDNGEKFGYEELKRQIILAGLDYYGREPGKSNTEKFITNAKNKGYIVQEKARAPYYLSNELIAEFWPKDIEEPKELFDDKN